MAEIRLEIKAGAVIGQITSLQGKLLAPNPLMAGIAAELLSMTEKAFAKEGYPDKWQSLAQSTIKQRTKKGHWPGKMLQVSAGGLAASVQPFSSSHQAGISVSKPYAAIHQFGGKAGKGRKSTIPARPYLPMRKQGSDLELTPQATESILRLTRHFFGS